MTVKYKTEGKLTLNGNSVNAPKAAPEVPMPSGPMNIAFGGFPK